MSGYVVVFSACANGEEAGRVARLLVERRLAACVNIIPGAHSYYWWNGKVERAKEHLLIIKSSRSLFPELREALREAHSYEVPEAIALSIAEGAGDYLRWLGANLRGGGAE